MPIETNKGTPDGEALANHMNDAAEHMRSALHRLHGLGTDELDPAEWSSRVCDLLVMTQRMEQLCEMVGRRYRGLPDAYEHQVGTDNGQAARSAAATIMLSLAKAKHGLAPVGEALTFAHQRAETLKLLVPDEEVER